MSLIDSHLEQISLSSNALANLPFPRPRVFTNALLGSHDITALIRDTEIYERALFQVSPFIKDHGSRQRTSRRGTTFSADSENEPMATRIYSARNNSCQSAVARVLGPNMMEEIKRSMSTSAGGSRGVVNIEILLRGAEILCDVYPIAGAKEKISSLRYRHEYIANSIAQLEDRVATNTTELEEMRQLFENDKYDTDYAGASLSQSDASIATDKQIMLELDEIRELERRKQVLEARVTGMQRDLGSLMD